MRIRLLIAFLPTFLFLSIVHAQNWQPVQAEKNYSYRIDTANHPTHPIQVDSTKSDNGHRHYFLNRGMEKCDTCTPANMPVVGYPEDTVYYHVEQPFFLQARMIDSNGYYHFQNPHHFVLVPGQPVDSPWLFRPDQQVKARIDTIYSSIIFGRPDSVKRILFGGRDTLLLSKNHGILQFPSLETDFNYHLTGVKDSVKRGTIIPDFEAIFKFEVGDVFQYKEYKQISPYPLTERYRFIKITITHKEMKEDTFTYQVKVRTLEKTTYPHYTHQESWVNHKKLQYINSPHLVNKFPIHHSVPVNSIKWRIVPPYNITRCQLNVDSNGKLTKYFGNKMAKRQHYSIRQSNFYNKAKGRIY